MGQSSTALAMANDAIDNARRAAASSRMKRASSPPPPVVHHTHRKQQQQQQQYHHQASSHHHAATETNINLDYVNEESGDINTTYTESMIIDISSPSNISSRDLEDLDLKHNDAAFNVVATLLCERLLPKIDSDMTTDDDHYYTITTEDVTFFQKMLPNSVRRDFVNALRYRLNLLRVVGSTSGGGIVHHDDDEGGGGCEQLSLQCQMLGLDRDDNMNLLLDNNFTAGKRVSFVQFVLVCHHIHVYSNLYFNTISCCYHLVQNIKLRFFLRFLLLTFGYYIAFVYNTVSNQLPKSRS